MSGACPSLVVEHKVERFPIVCAACFIISSSFSRSPRTVTCCHCAGKPLLREVAIAMSYCRNRWLGTTTVPSPKSNQTPPSSACHASDMVLDTDAVEIGLLVVGCSGSQNDSAKTIIPFDKDKLLAQRCTSELAP